MKSQEIGNLRASLKRKPYLTINCTTGDAALLSQSEVFSVVGSTVHLIMDARTGLAEFAKLTKEQVSFSLADLSKVADVDYHTLHYWVREGLLTPTVRPERGVKLRFDLVHAFAAGILGTLKRRGISLAFSRAVVDLLIEAAKRPSAKV